MVFSLAGAQRRALELVTGCRARQGSHALPAGQPGPKAWHSHCVMPGAAAVQGNGAGSAVLALGLAAAWQC